MIVIEISVLVLVMVGVFLFLMRDAGPTRSVAHVLYDAEHSSRHQR